VITLTAWSQNDLAKLSRISGVLTREISSSLLHPDDRGRKARREAHQGLAPAIASPPRACSEKVDRIFRLEHAPTL
jgi:hypothetical protein